MHYSSIYSFGRSVPQRLRVVDSSEQYRLKNNRLRQFERSLSRRAVVGWWRCLLGCFLWLVEHFEMVLNGFWIGFECSEMD